jgi:pimeloyl-ACP methyl ester carboxylesterase
MSAITVGEDLVHYEVLGRGRPVILVHGWLGSWRYWIPIMRQLQLRYRVYAVDLFGFGDSSKNPGKYPVRQQVVLLDEFMSQLGVPKAAVLAHGFGAQVVAEFARQYPERVARVLMAGVPLFDPGDLATRVPAGHGVAAAREDNRPVRGSSKPLASKSGNSSQPPGSYTDETIIRRPPGWERLRQGSLDDRTLPSASNDTVTNPNQINRDRLQRAALTRDGSVLPGDDDSNVPATPIVASNRRANNPLREALEDSLENLLARCFRRSEPEFEKLQVDVSRTDEAIIDRATEDFDAGVMLDTLRILDMPTVLVHGELDPVIPAPDETIWNYLTLGNDDRLLPIPLPGVRHFPMLEHEPFSRLVNNFLETPDISTLEVKERWRRRAR